jgi:signal transduction histidine kinase
MKQPKIMSDVSRIIALNRRLESCPKPIVLTASVALVGIIGLVDYFADYTLLFEAFYLLPVMLTAWRVGSVAGMVIAVMSVGAWQAGDFAAGVHYSSAFVPVWNGIIAMTVYFVVVRTLVSLRKLQSELEERVRQRTLALAGEMQERARLEKELVEIGEQAQRQFGNDLHDTLGQHLTATAFAGQVLTEKLESKSPAEAAASRDLVELLEEAIDLTRQFARGLQPVEMKPEGLMDGFQELAHLTSNRFGISCEFECRDPVLLNDKESSTHLYRIAQEAVTNAIRHGRAKFINISLEKSAEATTMTITDDGEGVPAATPPDAGMGLRIMAYRANMIGATFQIERLPDSGTRVTVNMPTNRVISANRASQD